MNGDRFESPAPRSGHSSDNNDQEDGAVGNCPNCGKAVHGRYCPSCGQKNQPLRQPVHHFASEAFVEFFGVDGRVWRSLKLLLVPGRLTQEYLVGRRVTFLRPLRLYLTASISFFLLLAVLDPVGGVIERVGASADSSVVVRDQLVVIDSTLASIRLEEERQAQEVDSLEGVVAQLRADSLEATARSVESFARLKEVDEAMEDLEEDLEVLDDFDDRSSWQRLRHLEWQRDLLATWPADSVIQSGDLDAAAARLFPSTSVNIDLPGWMPTGSSMNRLRKAGTSEEAISAIVDLVRGALAHLPTVMFLLLPVFALLLKLIYLRRGWYYTEHLVFALHAHAFAFLIFLFIAILLALPEGAGWARQASSILFLTIPLYFYVAQKRVYEQGWLRTALKALILGWLYVTVLVGLGVALAFALAAILG